MHKTFHLQVLSIGKCLQNYISLPLWNITFCLGSVGHLLLWPWLSELIVYQMVTMPYHSLFHCEPCIFGYQFGWDFPSPAASQHAGLGFDPRGRGTSNGSPATEGGLGSSGLRIQQYGRRLEKNIWPKEQNFMGRNCHIKHIYIYKGLSRYMYNIV